MKTLLSACFVLCVGVLTAIDAFLGPFEMHLSGGFPSARKPFFDEPVCHAIQNRHQLEMVVTWKDSSDGTAKVTTKRILVEPYLFGYNDSGEPILRGKIVEEKVLKEVTVKYGDQEDQGVFSGIFKPSKSENQKNSEAIPLDQVRQIKEIAQSSFDPPKDIKKMFKGDVAQVVCTVTPL